VPMRWGLIPGWWKSRSRICRARSTLVRIRCRAADVPQCVQATPLHHPSKRVLRMDGRERANVTASVHSSRGFPLLAFADLWASWVDPATGEEVLSCTMTASPWMEPYHDRMPVLLEPKDFDRWLDGSLGAEALKPATDSALREWIVSPRVDRTVVGDDVPTIIEPLLR
jgi:putative SOS response-associated peptidase YedK